MSFDRFCKNIIWFCFALLVVLLTGLFVIGCIDVLLNVD